MKIIKKSFHYHYYSYYVHKWIKISYMIGLQLRYNPIGGKITGQSVLQTPKFLFHCFNKLHENMNKI